EKTADPRGWKTLRGSMGSIFHLPVGQGTVSDAMAEATHAGMSVIAAVAEGGVPLPELDLRGPALLLVGSEGAGLPADVQQKADERVTIPMRARRESLYVAVTAALLLFEMRRQRLLP